MGTFAEVPLDGELGIKAWPTQKTPHNVLVVFWGCILHAQSHTPATFPGDGWRCRAGAGSRARAAPAMSVEHRSLPGLPLPSHFSGSGSAGFKRK